MRSELAEWPWQYLDFNDVGGIHSNIRALSRWPVRAPWPAMRDGLFAGLASLEVALPTPAEGAVAATAVDDGRTVDEEIGDAL